MSVDHFGVSSITTVFFAEQIQMIEFHPYFAIAQTYSSKFVWDVTHNVDITSTMYIILVWVDPTTTAFIADEVFYLDFISFIIIVDFKVKI